jgi:hypothetical protein
MTWIDPIWYCLYMTSPPADGLMCFARLVLDGFESGSDDVGGSWLSMVLLFGLGYMFRLPSRFGDLSLRNAPRSIGDVWYQDCVPGTGYCVYFVTRNNPTYASIPVLYPLCRQREGTRAKKLNQLLTIAATIDSSFSVSRNPELPASLFTTTTLGSALQPEQTPKAHYSISPPTLQSKIDGPAPIPSCRAAHWEVILALYPR